MPKYPDAKFVRIMHDHVSGGESPQDSLFDVTGFARAIWDLSIESMSAFPVLEDLANYHKRPNGVHVFRCKKLLWSTESEDYAADLKALSAADKSHTPSEKWNNLFESLKTSSPA
jgi:hypothetical protein